MSPSTGYRRISAFPSAEFLLKSLNTMIFTPASKDTTHSKMCMLNKSNGIITVRAFNQAVFDPLLSDILAFQSCLRRLGAGPRTLLIRIAGNANFYNNRTFLLVIPHARHRRSVDQDSTNTISLGSLPQPCPSQHVPQ